MRLIFFIKTFLKTFKTLRKDKKIFNSFDYYTDLNEIPLWNWWKCKEEDYSYLWKIRQNYVPAFFKQIYAKMYFDLEFIDNEDLRKTTQANYYQNLYLTTKDIKYKRKADTKFAEIESNKAIETKDITLNETIKIVQTHLKLTWQIDPFKISAGYFLSLLNEVRNGNYRKEANN